MSVRTVGGITQGDVCEVLWGDGDQIPEWWNAQVIAISLENVTVKFLTEEALISDDPEFLIPVSELGSKLREQQLFTSSTQSKSSRSRGARVVPVGCKRSAEGQLRREGMGGIGGQRQDTDKDVIDTSDSSDSDGDREEGLKRKDIDSFGTFTVGENLRYWKVQVMKGLQGDLKPRDNKIEAKVLVEEHPLRPVLIFREPEMIEDCEGKTCPTNSGLNVGVVIVHADGQYTEIRNLNSVKFTQITDLQRDQPSWERNCEGKVFQDGCCVQDSRTPLERLLCVLGYDRWGFQEDGLSTPQSTRSGGREGERETKGARDRDREQKEKEREGEKGGAREVKGERGRGGDRRETREWRVSTLTAVDEPRQTD
jgi:hypothetical protein